VGASTPGSEVVGRRIGAGLLDALVLLYLVGVIAILARGRRTQRLGDMAAGTTVVRA
jgi:uncharacterized RDD family membrane protein YckC